MNNESLNKIYQHFKKIHTLESIASTLHWDVETFMPKNSAEQRGEQLSLLNSMIHNLSTDKNYIDQVMSIDELNLESEIDKMHVSKLKKDLHMSLCVDQDFVERSTKSSLECHEKWKEAREKNDFKVVKNALNHLLNIKKEYAQKLKNHKPLSSFYENKSLYEVLVDSFEPGISSDYLKKELKALVEQTIELLPSIETSQKELSNVTISMDTDKQHKIVLMVAEALGFDFSRGRIDKSVHPFCSGNREDTRMTTRYDAKDAVGSIWSTIHETGHGIYEQNIPKNLFSLPCGTAASMGVHESQSRFYENQIGRSMPFCEWLSPQLNISPKELYTALNKVQKSFIRTESDEVTYNLHIYLRFKLEEQLISGQLDVDHLEDAWNEEFQKSFGMKPSSALVGVLQDTHWYGGMFGYFPTYSLGNLLASELFEIYKNEFSNWEDLVRSGNFKHIKEFMNQRVHSYAAKQNSPETMKKILSGRLPSAGTLTKQFKDKYCH